MAFLAPSIQHTVDTLELFLSESDGNGQLPGGGIVSVSLARDDGGLPGTVLETVSSGGFALNERTVVAFQFSGTTAIDPLEQYWVTLSASPESVFAWWPSIAPATLNALRGGGDWFVVMPASLAFRVSATPVPEPGSALLIALGLSGFGLRREHERPPALGDRAQR